MTTAAFTIPPVTQEVLSFFFLMKEFAVTEMVEAKAGQKIIRQIYSDRTSQNHGYNMRA